jgi:hypothetical protein
MMFIFRQDYYWILDTGCWMLDTGYWILDTGYWILDTGYWILEYEFARYTPPYQGGMKGGVL